MTSTSKGSLYITISALFYASYGLWSRLMNHSFGEFNGGLRGSILLTFRQNERTEDQPKGD